MGEEKLPEEKLPVASSQSPAKERGKEKLPVVGCQLPVKETSEFITSSSCTGNWQLTTGNFSKG
jgi:hypothetical protein